MGKKRIIRKSQEELLAEREVVEGAVQQAAQQQATSPRRFEEGMVKVLASYNNTILALTDMRGNVLTQVSAGAIGFRGSKKATPFAAARAAEALAEKAKKIGLRRVHVYVKGIGSGRESAIRSLATHGLEINKIRDITPLPHNGPRPRKPRRV